MKPRCYVAGPISRGNLIGNICQATFATITLIRAGLAPLCPHLTCYLAGPTPEVLPAGTTHEDWMGVDLPWVSVAHVLLRLPGESVGADLEVACAVRHGIPVFHSVEEVVKWTKKQ